VEWGYALAAVSKENVTVLHGVLSWNPSRAPQGMLNHVKQMYVTSGTVKPSIKASDWGTASSWVPESTSMLCPSDMLVSRLVSFAMLPELCLHIAHSFQEVAAHVVGIMCRWINGNWTRGICCGGVKISLLCSGNHGMHGMWERQNVCVLVVCSYPSTTGVSFVAEHT